MLAATRRNGAENFILSSFWNYELWGVIFWCLEVFLSTTKLYHRICLFHRLVKIFVNVIGSKRRNWVMSRDRKWNGCLAPSAKIGQARGSSMQCLHVSRTQYSLLICPSITGYATSNFFASWRQILKFKIITSQQQLVTVRWAWRIVHSLLFQFHSHFSELQ